MRIEQLKAFLAVAETGSFQKAARQCGVTQSTISRQIQALETELGSPLLHRTAQAKLTVAGDLLLPRARKIYQEWNVAKSEIADLTAGKQQELCVAVIPSIGACYLPGVLQRFVRDYPQVQLRVTSLGSDRALKVLRDGLVDLALVMQSNLMTPSSEMVVDFLYEEPILVLLASGHPLADFISVPWSELIQYPQVIFKEGYAMQSLVREQFHRRGAKLNIVLELNSLDAFRGTIRQGNWIALLPQSALLDINNDLSLAVRPLEKPTLMRQVVLVTTQDRLQIPPIKHFRELVLELIKPKADLMAIVN